MYTGHYYLSLNKILLLAVGVWPYQQRKINQFQSMVLFNIVATSIISQLATFLTSNCNPRFVIKVLSVAFYFTTLLIKYWSFLRNMEVVKYLLDQLQCTYHELKDENEIAIIRRYWKITSLYTNACTALCICSVVFFILSPTWSSIFGFILPMNKIQAKSAPSVVTEYFIDQEKYFYLIMLHTNAAYCIGILAVLATGSMSLAYLRHGCGMFKIAGYRMERIMTNNVAGNEYLIERRIIYAVDMHRKAMKLVSWMFYICEYMDFMLSNFMVPYFFLIIFIVIVTSLNLFRIFQCVSSGCDINEFVSSFIFLITHYVFMFMSHYHGQEVMDHNDQIFTKVYNTYWYMAPLHIQKVILFLLQRSTRVYNLNIGGIFVASLEGFCSMASISISYFTVICSMEW